MRTTIQMLKDLLQEFRDERDWKKFHDLKNLAEAISIRGGRAPSATSVEGQADIRKSAKGGRAQHQVGTRGSSAKSSLPDQH